MSTPVAVGGERDEEMEELAQQMNHHNTSLLDAASSASSAGAAESSSSLSRPPLENNDDGDNDNDADDDAPFLPPYIVARVARLQRLDQAREQIMEEYRQARAALEQTFAARCLPLYQQRAQIVNGEVHDDDNDDAMVDEDGLMGDKGAPKKLRGIPQFWIVAMSQNETISELIEEQDVECLYHLRDVTCRDDDDGKGFTLSFHFGPNEYFHDSILTKRYQVPNLLFSDEPLLKQVEGCKIQWKDDTKSLTYRKVKKTQRGTGKNQGQVRTVFKTEKKDSFFHWFDPPRLPTMEELDEDEAKRLEEIFDSDYEVAQAFRTQLIPRAVMWFSGEAAEREIVEAMSDAFSNDGGEDAVEAAEDMS